MCKTLFVVAESLLSWEVHIGAAWLLYMLNQHRDFGSVILVSGQLVIVGPTACKKTQQWGGSVVL